MTDTAIETLFHEILLARASGDWTLIDMRQIVDALEEEGVELEQHEFEKIVSTNPDFVLGNDLYQIVHRDNGVATWRCDDWSALTLSWSPEDKVISLQETHPY